MTVSPELIQLAKQAVGQQAAQLVTSGMVVGLGTGSTAAWMIQALGERLRRGEIQDIRGVPTSFQATVLARQAGIPLTSLDEVETLDLAIDGADEVDPQKNLIKGGGAAHTREKIVDSLARELVVVVDESKLVERLGSRFPVPVEVLPMAVRPVMRALEKLGGQPELRMAVKKDGPVITDLGNMVVDVKFAAIPDPAALEARINNIPGVVENGLFVGLAGRVLIGRVVDGQPHVQVW
ncbi:MAG: ribose-5-phosphate isomerase RpiA [Gloeomargarita sp. SKYBB_i_bin120]|nr:ribose-5-phosphate isomerase RpiA [Gloeomargarita sp. SKYG98]MCS7291754.1 ribose-5-phosphate isomerase RpiA [Gloeomargarita sp. SKYB120]MDW8177314.1 ribose-5-phosphate isomerase RpiA [Gloeomargarita sp. SKYBB_i_bin120]